MKKSGKENKLSQKKGSKRKFNEDYIKYGFIASGSEDIPLPYCLICKKSLSNESLVPNKQTDICRITIQMLKPNQGNILRT